MDSTANLKSSEASIKRMTKDHQEIEESEAVKEYKFITQQIHSGDEPN